MSRSVVTHSTQGVYHSAAVSDRSGSQVEQPAMVEDFSRLKQNATRFNDDGANFSSERKSEDDSIVHIVSESVEKAVLQSPSVRMAGLQGPLLSTVEHVQVTSFEPASCEMVVDSNPHAVAFNRPVSYSASTSLNSSKFKMPEVGPNTSVITTAAVKKERNNNSFSNNAISAMLQQQKQTADQNEAYKDLSSNLSARYEKVLFQRNQDFSKLASDEEFIIPNRVKEKVH